MRQIHHLIDGQQVAGESGRTSPVFNPASGQQTGQLSLASAAEVDTAVTSAQAAFEEWGNVSVARRTTLMFAFRNLVVDNADRDRQAPHCRARQGPRRCHGRGGPGHRQHRIRLRFGRASQRKPQRDGVHRNRRLHGAPPAGGGGRDHAVQLPGHGSDVDGAQRHRLREHVCAQAVGARPVGPDVHRRAVPRSGLSSRCAQSGEWRQSGGRPAA